MKAAPVRLLNGTPLGELACPCEDQQQLGSFTIFGVTFGQPDKLPLDSTEYLRANGTINIYDKVDGAVIATATANQYLSDSEEYSISPKDGSTWLHMNTYGGWVRASDVTSGAPLDTSDLPPLTTSQEIGIAANAISADTAASNPATGAVIATGQGAVAVASGISNIFSYWKEALIGVAVVGGIIAIGVLTKAKKEFVD